MGTRNLHRKKLSWRNYSSSLLSPDAVLHSGHALATSSSNSLLWRHLRMHVKQKQWLQLGRIPKVCSSLLAFCRMVSKQMPHVLSADSTLFTSSTASSAEDVLGPSPRRSSLQLAAVVAPFPLGDALVFFGERAQAPKEAVTASVSTVEVI